MLKHWRTLLLMLAAMPLFFTACKKKSSPDNPLPINYNPSVIVGSNNCVLYALDPVTHMRNWEYGLPGAPFAKIYASPLVYNGMVYSSITMINPGIDVPSMTLLYKINAKTGKLVKEIRLDDGNPFNIYATPIADGDLIYVAGTNGILYAVNAETGNLKWTYNTADYGDGTSIKSSPVIYGDNIYIATEGGWVHCLNKTAGGTLYDAPFTATAPIWTLQVTDPDLGTLAGFISSPAISAPYLYVGSNTDSAMYCLYLNDIDGDQQGNLRWRYQARNQIESSPAVYKGRCIFGCNDFRVYCLDTGVNPPVMTTPLPIWITKTNGRVISSPFVSNQVVYIGSDDAFLYALNILNGGIKWQFQTNGPIVSSPLAYSGSIYVGSADKNLYCVDSARGTLRWYYNVNGVIECSPTIDNLTGAQVNSQMSGFTN